MTGDDEGRVVITLRDVYDKVASVEGSVQTMSGVVPTVADHEGRLRRIERLIYASLAAGGGSIASAVYTYLEGHPHG